MSKSSNRRMQQRFATVIGGLMVFAMAASVLLPLLNTAPVNPELVPTSTPAPTIPAPIEDLNLIQFNQTYLHPSGLFTAAIPTGWDVSSEYNTTGEAVTVLRNEDVLSEVQVRVIRPVAGVSLDADGLDTFFDATRLNSSWGGYAWDETSRRTEDGQLVLGFTATQGAQEYIARQVAFADDTWIYVVRVMTLSNASRMLLHILDNEVASFELVDNFKGAAMEWNAYFDTEARHLLRYPSIWLLTDSAPGAPASINGQTVALRVEALPNTLDTVEAAREYVGSLASSVEVLTAEETEQFGANGYKVAYTLPTLDGPSQSGVVLVLNGADQAHVANLLLQNIFNTDLLATEDLDAETTSALAALDTFSLYPDLEIASR